MYSVNDKEFLEYGKVINGFDTAEIIKECEKIKMPDNGSAYELSVSQLENLDIANKIKNDCFGGLDIQVGLCWGYNDMLNGLEYHKSSEINIAVTPFVLLLGKVYEMDGLKFDSKNVKAFYVEKGQMIEVYGTILHFCPCQVSKDGFSSVVVLHEGTNGLLDTTSDDKLLFKKNKWLICHEDNQTLLDKGVYPGLYGENYKIVGE